MKFTKKDLTKIEKFFDLFIEKLVWFVEHKPTLDFRKAITTINDKVREINSREEVFTTPLLREIGRQTFVKEGRNGNRDTFSFTKSIFQRHGTYINPDCTREETWSWGFLMEEYSAKPQDLNVLDHEYLQKNGMDITKSFENSMEKLLNNYETVFLPNIMKSVMYNVPPVGGVYSDNFGLLRETAVSPDRLQNADIHKLIPDNQPCSTIRNHYRQIIDPSKGVTREDIIFFKNYLMEYVNLAQYDVIVFMNHHDRSNFLYNVQTWLEGEDSIGSYEEVEDVRIYKASNNELPDGFMIVMVTDKHYPMRFNHNEAIIYKLIHNNPKFQGIKVETRPFKYTNELDIEDMKNIRLTIEDIGLYLTGRERMIIVDTAFTTSKENVFPNRYPIMSDARIKDLKKYCDTCYGKFVNLN